MAKIDQPTQRTSRKPGPKTGAMTFSPSPRTPEDDKSSDRHARAGLDFLKLVWRLDHGLRSRSKRMEQELGVTGPQRFTVRMLGAEGPLSAGELAEHLELHPSTLTGVRERLVRAGLVTRSIDPGDGRRAVLALTEAGRRVDRRQAGTVEAAVREVLRQTSAGDRAAARRVLERIVKALEVG
jgi:DNA-binding MarR family transcriptional regulator